MKTNLFYQIILLSFVIMICCSSNDDDAGGAGSVNETPAYPSFGPEVEVTINGLSFDAMEPFISPDGNYLLFNNLNDGINTKIYYATRVNDSVFNYTGELLGVNQAIPPHLDAVPDLDAEGNFYWTSTRNYPAELNNLFYGTFTDGVVEDIGRVQGNFYKNIPRWIVMDHGISWDGQFLYFNNARFDENSCQGPCETELGIAKKDNDSTFTTLPNSALILQNVTDADYIYYAPYISSDDLELYFTRYSKGQLTPATTFEICVAVREVPTAEFSTPTVLFSDEVANLIEAATLTVDKSIIYYHRKTGDTHRIVMRYRDSG